MNKKMILGCLIAILMIFSLGVGIIIGAEMHYNKDCPINQYIEECNAKLRQSSKIMPIIDNPGFGGGLNVSIQ